MAVVGAGAAGITAAIFAARAGARVVLLERTADGGRKILASGGGRCNVLPSLAAPERFVSEGSAALVRRLLLAWPLAEQRRFFEQEVGLPLALEEATGKLFPRSDRARDVRDGLLALARREGVDVRFLCTMQSLRREGAEWEVALAGAPAVRAARVVLATGGLSVPATGSDGTGLRALAALGHRMQPTYPALTPLLSEAAPHAHLAGLSLDVELRGPNGRPRTAGGFLFTHRGYSGPAVLDLAHLVTRARLRGEAIPSLRVRWRSMADGAWEDALAPSSRSAGAVLRTHLPARLADQLLAEAGVPAARPLAQLPRRERMALLSRLTAYPLPCTGDEGYKKAEVTGGGLDLGEVDARSLESRLHPGLHVCGEALDAFGPIGGHNFQWAWSTGRGAGLGAGSVR
ncbi:MAG TPA: aminoacetone oxidase family FAD-binding enzyme [Candidatus Polarisedimenticolaceae bacterium]|nr:aminoacetone oxidase family FAD-binding enzyme [Candidatus Polarisedimenticolaceae bacterium]